MCSQRRVVLSTARGGVELKDIEPTHLGLAQAGVDADVHGEEHLAVRASSCPRTASFSLVFRRSTRVSSSPRMSMFGFSRPAMVLTVPMRASTPFTASGDGSHGHEDQIRRHEGIHGEVSKVGRTVDEDDVVVGPGGLQRVAEDELLPIRVPRRSSAPAKRGSQGVMSSPSTMVSVVISITSRPPRSSVRTLDRARPRRAPAS